MATLCLILWYFILINVQLSIQQQMNARDSNQISGYLYLHGNLLSTLAPAIFYLCLPNSVRLSCFAWLYGPYTIIQSFLQAEICKDPKISSHCFPYLRDHSPIRFIVHWGGKSLLCRLFSIFLIVYSRRDKCGPTYSMCECGFSEINFSKRNMSMIDSEG